MVRMIMLLVVGLWIGVVPSVEQGEGNSQAALVSSAEREAETFPVEIGLPRRMKKVFASPDTPGTTARKCVTGSGRGAAEVRRICDRRRAIGPGSGGSTKASGTQDLVVAATSRGEDGTPRPGEASWKQWRVPLSRRDSGALILRSQSTCARGGARILLSFRCRISALWDLGRRGDTGIGLGMFHPDDAIPGGRLTRHAADSGACV
jgi:hypothetical protein